MYIAYYAFIIHDSFAKINCFPRFFAVKKYNIYTKKPPDNGRLFSFLLILLFQEFSRCHSGQKTEGRDKMTVVVEAAELCGFGNRLSLCQEELRIADSDEHNEFFDRDADVFLEIGDQLGTADEKLIGKAVNFDVVSIVEADMSYDLVDIAVGIGGFDPLLDRVLTDPQKHQGDLDERVTLSVCLHIGVNRFKCLGSFFGKRGIKRNNGGL